MEGLQEVRGERNKLNGAKKKKLDKSRMWNIFFFNFYLFIYLFMAVLGLRFLCEGFL